VDHEEARREAKAYASQSGEAGLGELAGGVGLEQLIVFYLLEEAGPVRVNEGWAEISFRAPAA
jgi:hypothetical protein